MLPLSQRVAFSLFAVVCLVFGARAFYRLYLRIARGRTDTDGRTDHIPQRLWNALSTTLLQTRVFRKRRVLSVFHSFIFYAFVLYILVNGVDAIDGFYDLRPIASPFLRTLYGSLADAFSVLAIVGVLAFVVRRFLFRRGRGDFRFNELTRLQPAIRNGYIQRDSLIVSAFILFHVGSRIIANAARLATEGPQPGQPFSTMLSGLFAGPHAMAWRIFGYWGALGSVLLFLVYFPYTKHIHLLMAPVKYFVRRDAGTGTLPALTIDPEALEAPEPQVGAAHVADLSWPRILDAYACIQCNRCQDVCPASQTGKALSPAALEINKRMVLNSITAERSAFNLTGKAAFEQEISAGPALLESVISDEAVWACTTCGACMQVCPTQDEQMLDIIDIRRNQVMLQGEFPSQLQTAFRGMERTSNPWGIAREKRMAWADGLNVPTIDEVPNPDVLYWVGCAASYDPSAQKTARATVQLLKEANVNFAVLGKRESCTGDSARRAGNELLYQELATTAIGTLNEVQPKTVIASCPHCVNIIGSEYPQLGGNFNVQHHTEFLASLVEQKRLTPAPSDTRTTFHDPCYLGRHRGTYDEPRSILKILSNDFVDLPRTRSNAFCCGAGGAQFWKEEERGTERISENRFHEAQTTLASGTSEKVLAVGCPFCKSMLQSTPSAGEDTSVVIKDVAELLWEGVQRAKPAAAEPQQTPTPNLAPVVMQSEVPALAAVPLQSSSSPASTTQLAPSEPTTVAVHETISAPPAHQQTTRKKWAPKTASAATIAEPATPSTPQTQQPSAPPSDSAAPPAPAPERKKWAPKTASAPAEAAAQPVAAEPATRAHEPVSISAPEAPPAPTPQRKKWTPKTEAAPQSEPQAAPQAQPETSATTQPTSSPAEPTPTAPTARKKWQPGGPK